MVKITQSNNQFRVTIPPDIMRAFGLGEGKIYDWVSVGGMPTLTERRSK